MVIDIRESVDFVTSIIFLLIFTHFIYRRYGTLIATSFFYFFVSCLIVFMNSVPFYNLVFANVAGNFLRVHVPIAYVSAQACVLGAMIFMFTAFSKMKTIFQSINIIKYLILLNAIFVCLIKKPWNGGLWWGNSFDLTMAAIVMPLFFRGFQNKNRIDQACVALILITATKVSSITPFIIMGFSFVAYYFKATAKQLFYATCAIAFTISATIGYIVSTPLHLTERTDVWLKVTKVFVSNFNPLIGTGGGTYRVVGPLMQNESINTFYFLHNEPLQIFIEYGLIGLALASILCFKTFKGIDDKGLRVSFVALLIASVAHYPLRVGVSQLFLFLLMRVGLDKNINTEDKI